MAEAEEVKISADIPSKLHKELTKRAEDEGRKIKWYVTRGLELVLKEKVSA